MSDSLKNYGKHAFQFKDNTLIVKDDKGAPFKLLSHILDWEGNTVFERTHPTFISKKRKVILTCPRKVGHSSIRFYLNYMNEEENDDWIWIEDFDRNPSNFLDEEDRTTLYNDLLQKDNKLNVVAGKEPEKIKTRSAEYQYHYASECISNSDREKINEYFGKDNHITWVQDFAENTEQVMNREQSFYPPFQTLSPFKEYTSYLVVRDPWDRFISGLITEMDNGLMNPWKYDLIGKTEKGWELLYNACKRILFFTEPEYLTIGGLDGPQANHTFILSRPLWKGKSMYDIYDNFIHYKHDIEYHTEDNGHVGVNHTSLQKDTGVIASLVKLGFISQEAVTRFHEEEQHNMHGHTHINVTPHIRQHVISELQDDEDLYKWWGRCRELVDIEYECLKNNKHKFKNT